MRLHLLGAHVAEEDAVVTQDESAVVGVELDVVEVTRHVVGPAVALPALTLVVGVEHAARATHDPELLAAGLGGEVEQAEAAAANLALGEVVILLGELIGVAEVDAAAAGELPDPAVGAPAHALHPAAGRAVVRLPVGLARGPRHVKVAAGGQADVVAVVVPRDGGQGAGVVRGALHAGGYRAVEGAGDGLLHRRLPVARGVGGEVDGALVGDQLSLAGASGGGDEHGRAGEPGGEADPFPVLAAVGGVEQDRGLADDPALLPAERDGVEAVVHILVGALRDGLEVPGLAAVGGLEDGLAGTEEEAALRVVGDERDVQEDDAGLEREVDDLPVLGHLLSLGGARGHGRDGRRGEARERALGDVTAAEGGGVLVGGGLHDLDTRARGGFHGRGGLHAKAVEGGGARLVGGGGGLDGRGDAGGRGGGVHDGGHLSSKRRWVRSACAVEATRVR